jgi:hypothetical protein
LLRDHIMLVIARRFSMVDALGHVCRLRLYCAHAPCHYGTNIERARAQRTPAFRTVDCKIRVIYDVIYGFNAPSVKHAPPITAYGGERFTIPSGH